MKRGITVLICVCALVGAVYFAISKWGIRHETLNLFDTVRQRPVAVDLAVRRDYEMKADAGYWKLPVAIISNGNTVKNTEYSFLANVLAARGYLVASVQQDIPTDPPLMTKVGLPYVGRREVYEKGEANILVWCLDNWEKSQPNADYNHLTSRRALQWRRHRDVLRQAYILNTVSKVVTLDNLRVPFVLNDKMKILSFRSKDPQIYRPIPAYCRTPEQAKLDGIDIVRTQFQHTDMSDRGPYSVKEEGFQATLDAFLGSGGSSSELAPAPTDNPIVTNAGAPLP